MNNSVNNCISCSVASCEHHSNTTNACTLDHIKVGCCGEGSTVTCCSGTECASFRSAKTSCI